MFKLFDWVKTGLARICAARGEAKSFAIERHNGSTVFVEATDFTIDADGRLVFYAGWRKRKVAAYTDWVRVMRGVSPADLEKAI